MSFDSDLEEDPETFEHTLLVVREVSVFKIPPRSTSGGYKCGEWLQSDKIWSGRLRVVSCSNNRCEIRLEDPNSGDLFAACFVNPGEDRYNSVESVLDSSRYFVLKVEDGAGKHAFLGLGFSERNEAFDFNVALSDHEKYVKREIEKDSVDLSDVDRQINIHPAVNHRLKIWSGRLRVVSCSNNRCEIRLEDPNSGDLFAACFVNPGEDRYNSVESVLDSSRYFVLKVEDGAGKHAFLGLGFSERNEAFDFNVALSDHEKYVKREIEKDSGDLNDVDRQINIHPAVNHRLKEGETIRITVKNKPASGAGMLSAAGLSGGATGTEKIKPLSLAPPPSASSKLKSVGTEKLKPLSLAPPPTTSGKIRSAIPPPPNDPAAVRMTSISKNAALKGHNEAARKSTDAFTDFSQIERNLPSTTGSGSNKSKTTAAGWAAF